MSYSRPVFVSSLRLAVCLITIGVCDRAHALASGGIKLPVYNDKYSNFVRQLEAGRTNINYTQFRNSFLESEQFKVAGVRHVELQELRQRMHQLMRQSKHAQVAEIAKRMLGIDYTDMEAHKILRQASKVLGSTANAQKHHDIEFGLLYSIIRKRDGKTCQTGWAVIQVTEEYFILEMVGAKLLRQSLDTSGGFCDKMEVQTNEGKKTYYFEVSKVFEGYKKRGMGELQR